MPDRYVCAECGWHGDQPARVSLTLDLGQGEEVSLVVCPQCRGIESTLSRACDEPGCAREASMGTPTPTGYRSTCWDHRPAASGEPAQ